MNEYKIQFSIDGTKINQSEILEVELSRYHHVFKVFNEKSIVITLNDQVQSMKQLMALDLEHAKLALAQTREKMGKEQTLISFRPEIDRSDAMWRSIAKNAHDNEPPQQAIVEVETENISLYQFLMFNQSLAKKIIYICHQ